MYIALVEMTLLICALLALLWRICRQGRFTFLIWLICLLIASDIGAILLNIGFHFEGSPAHANHTTPLSINMGVSTVLFNAGSLCMQWLFAIKYWIISKEVPKLFEGQRVNFGERAYKFLNISGLVIIVLTCIGAGYFRGQLTMHSVPGTGSPPQNIADIEEYFYFAMTALELVAGCFLLDALRRILKSVKENPFMQANQRTMWLHILFLVFDVGITVATALFVFRAFSDPSNL